MEDVVAKKRGRPAKSSAGGVAAAASTSPVENIPTIPKKRGRPPKAKGRGRPAKFTPAVVGSDNEDLDHDELGEANGELPMPLKSTGKGRGRPRKMASLVVEHEDDDDDGDSSADEKPPAKQQKSPSSAKRRKLGRPRKHQPSDNDEVDDDDDEEERRPAGRPNTNAVNLNIVRTGRGQGRPKKGKSSDDGSTVPKKRGRPASGKGPVAAYVPSGRPRGRPKASHTLAKAAIEDDEDQQQDDDSEDEKSGEGEELAAVATPKKRGRPTLAGNNKSAASSAKSRGRPKTNKSPSYQLDDDAEDLDSATEVGEESNGNVPKKRGRPSLATPRGRPKSTKSVDANGSDSLSGDADEDNDDSSGVGNVSGELAAKQPSNSDSKSERKELKSPANGDGDADDGDAGNETAESVECISDEQL